jgi:hypothetical protein
MSAPLPRPSASSGDGMSGCATAHGKIALATQRQREREKLLAVVAKSCEPAIDKTHAHNRVAPAMPSSVDRANRLYQRSAKKLPKQPVITSVSTVIAIPIPELSQFQSMTQMKVRITVQNYSIVNYWLRNLRRQLLSQLNKRRLRTQEKQQGLNPIYRD